MNAAIDSVVNDAKAQCDRLLASMAYGMDSLPTVMPDAGITLFTEDEQAMYVGRTNRLRKRLQSHLQNNHNQATFAFLLARRTIGQIKASCKKDGSRSALLTQPNFRAAFDKARDRIRRMSVQWIEEKDPVKQTLLEVFAALRTGAKYNILTTIDVRQGN